MYAGFDSPAFTTDIKLPEMEKPNSGSDRQPDLYHTFITIWFDLMKVTNKLMKYINYHKREPHLTTSIRMNMQNENPS